MAKEKEAPKKTKRPTALKRDLQSEKKRIVNREYRSQMRTAIRRFEDNVTQGKTADLKKSLNDVYSILDKSVKKGIIKKNKASRSKARLTAKLAKAEAK